MTVLSTLLNTSQLTITVIVGLTSAILLYLMRRYKSKSEYVDEHEPSPHISCQSVVVDEANHIRSAVVSTKYPELRKLQTTKEIFRHALTIAPHRYCCGKRPDFNTTPQWTTYEEVYNTIQLVGSGLVYVSNASPNTEVFIGIYGRNAPEWICTQYACGNYGLVAVPLYDTLGNEALEHIMKQTQLCIAVCDTAKHAKNLLTRSTSSLKYIVVWQNDAELIELRAQDNDVSIITFEELLETGRLHWISERHVQPDDLFLVCYTSGSTGLPKGVIYTHQHFMNCMLRAYEYLGELSNKLGINTHVSYLPLSHIMEQLVIGIILFSGSCVAFLTTDITGLMRDLSFYRPTVFFAVPRILTRMYTDSVKKSCSNRFSRWLFEYAIQQKLDQQKNGLYVRHGLLDSVFFEPIRTQLGGRVKFVVCGSAPLQPDVLRFTKAVFSCPVMEGYGSTESGGIVCMSLIGDQSVGHVGALGVGVKVKLVDVPDMGIVVKQSGIGEVCVYSDGLTKGYYQDEDKTREMFDEDGFLRTGDVACWTENGALRIVDRCKNIFKLAQGEYVAPERVEQIYMTSPLINSVYVEGNSLHSFAVGVVVPNWTELRKRFVREEPESGTKSIQQDNHFPTNGELCTEHAIKRSILEELNTIGKQKGLKSFEQVKDIHIALEPFTVANGFLTPTMKIARPVIRRHFAKAVAEMYKSGN